MVTGTAAFATLGFRLMPIGTQGARLIRHNTAPKGAPEKLKKVCVAGSNIVPTYRKDWTRIYGENGVGFENTTLGAVICGVLSNRLPYERQIVALDCDNALAWQVFDSLNPEYAFKSKSIGKEGGTIFYQLPLEMIDIPKYSVDVDGMLFEFIARRASGINDAVLLPTSGNETKTTVDPATTVLQVMPASVCTLVRKLYDAIPKPETGTAHEPSRNTRPFQNLLVQAFVKLCREAGSAVGAIYGKVPLSGAAIKVYRGFTTKRYQQCPNFQEHRYLLPDDPAIMAVGTKASYLLSVSTLAGRDPSVDAELYTQFMAAFNQQLAQPYPEERLAREWVTPMISKKSTVDGVPIWRYHAGWNKETLQVINEYGELLEYYYDIKTSSAFVEYNHTTSDKVMIKGTSALVDHLNCVSSDVEPFKKSVVKRIRAVRLQDSIRKKPGLEIDLAGKPVLNSSKACTSLQILRNPEQPAPLVETEALKVVQAFDLFISHLLNGDEVAIKYLKNVIAYHGEHLQTIPIILYVVGVGGAGKSIFASLLERLFGHNATARPSAEQIKSKYNDFLENKALLVLTETSDSAYATQAGIKEILKTITGEEAIDIEAKYKTVQTNVPVFVLPVVLANSTWYEEDGNDRRLFSINPRGRLKEDKAIQEYESKHKVEIVTVLKKGAEDGTLARHLARNFRCSSLPEVPITEDKKRLASQQKNAVANIKSLVEYSDWPALFSLMEEHDIKRFFQYMDTPVVPKDVLNSKHLVALCERVSGVYNGNKIVKQFASDWLPAKHFRQAPDPALPNFLIPLMGYDNWRIEGLGSAYETWRGASHAEEAYPAY